MKKYSLVSYKGSPQGISGETVNTNLDKNHSCSNCGTGTTFSQPLRIKGLKIQKNKIFETYNSDWIITEDLYKKLLTKEINIDTLNVANHKGVIIENYRCISPSITFPKKLEISDGYEIESQCPICERNGYFNRVELPKDLSGYSYVYPLRFYYPKVLLDKLPNKHCFFTWEQFGKSKKLDNKIIALPRPKLIVSEELKLFLSSVPRLNLLFEEIFFV